LKAEQAIENPRKNFNTILGTITKNFNTILGTITFGYGCCLISVRVVEWSEYIHTDLLVSVIVFSS